MIVRRLPQTVITRGSSAPAALRGGIAALPLHELADHHLKMLQRGVELQGVAELGGQALLGVGFLQVTEGRGDQVG